MRKYKNVPKQAPKISQNHSAYLRPGHGQRPMFLENKSPGFRGIKTTSIGDRERGQPFKGVQITSHLDVPEHAICNQLHDSQHHTIVLLYN